ncbi:cytochrome c oxidase assembly protein [Mesobacterium pallidum]|uniref:cytochrome c oxidase assembly protein n=1 Tax=Mesobacterium pallidum TaxID=2872037 RepID=UPI001EE18425|nr:cytochrome c oxidase assembly protein [Mesobacterium pallidum]
MKRLEGPNRTVAYLVGVVVFMGAMAWAAVPFYDWFCRVTGFGGTTGVASDAAYEHEVLDQTIKVRFDASVERDFPWVFKPMTREMEINIGQDALVFYEAYNPTDRPIAGAASYNVVPYQAGGFFIKVECFCFTEQVLQPGERVEMPVSFYVDPEIVEDREGQYIHNITLGYTFHEIDLPEDQAASLETEQDASFN